MSSSDHPYRDPPAPPPPVKAWVLQLRERYEARRRRGRAEQARRYFSTSV